MVELSAFANGVILWASIIAILAESYFIHGLTLNTRLHHCVHHFSPPSRCRTLPNQPVPLRWHSAKYNTKSFVQNNDEKRVRTIALGKLTTEGDEESQSSPSSANYIDAVVEEKTSGLAVNDEEIVAKNRRKRDVFRKALRDLASLSLIDYKWRSALFKKNEADRMEEEMVARMMGEDASYARPMDADAARRGPLGNAEKKAVQWLTSVIEEEGKRARLIADSDGKLIRPKDLSPTEYAGPLSDLERRAIQFLNDISDAEVQRVRSGTIRPKDMEIRGPLGEAEAKAVLALGKIIESERYRMNQSRKRGGERVRPIDVPGPLGEFEKYVGDIIRSERQRVKDRQDNEGKLVRPKDASMSSALGDVERKASEDWELLRREENERLLSLGRFLNERRPMEANKDSPLGVTEAFTVGLLRGPRLLARVAGRVKELLKSEELDAEDKEILQKSLPGSGEGGTLKMQEQANLLDDDDQEDATVKKPRP